MVLRHVGQVSSTNRVKDMMSAFYDRLSRSAINDTEIVRVPSQRSTVACGYVDMWIWPERRLLRHGNMSGIDGEADVC
jgi:hypothetical protein